MRIALISNYPPDGQQSMGRYATMLHSILSAAGYGPTLVYPPVLFGRLAIGPASLRKWIGYIDKFLLAPLYLRWKVRGADIVHVCDHSNAMYLPWVGGRIQVITCHDLLAILSAEGRFSGIRIGLTGRILQRWIASSLSNAQNVICVSRKTEADWIEFMPKLDRLLRVIHHPLNRQFGPVPRNIVDGELCRLGLKPPVPYLLHVGGNQWYKNRIAVLKIWKELLRFPKFQSMRLVMAGKPMTQAMREFCVAANLQSSVVEAVSVNDGCLCALYSGAEALLFPSREEGFGWPILEAQACQCPVITSNKAPMTEVAGDAAIFINPDDPNGAAQTIFDQWPRRGALIEDGTRNLRRFEDAAVAEAYAKVYEELLGQTVAQAGPIRPKAVNE